MLGMASPSPGHTDERPVADLLSTLVPHKDARISLHLCGATAQGAMTATVRANETTVRLSTLRTDTQPSCIEVDGTESS
jgi:hypothetical protein